MKKMKLLVLGCGLLLVTSLAPKQTLIKENEDLILSCEEKNNVGINLKKLASTSSATVGKTYVQNGEYEANKMLRFATPVNGDFDSLTYHIEIEGYPEVVSKNVETVYKGIEANGAVSYFNGTDVVTEKSELTEDWYWACFTIEFTSYKYYTASINAYVTGSSSSVEGELKSEAKNDVSLRDELMKGDTPSLKALDTKTLGEWRNDGATIVVKNKQLTYSKGGVDTVLNYVSVDGYYYVFADGNNNELKIKYSSQYSNQLDVNGVINESKFYQSFSKFVAITSLELTTKKTELVYGLDSTFTISATTNKDATGEDIVWSCDDDRFELDGSGKSIYVSVPELYEFEDGEENVIVTFTAKSAEGGVSDSINITIRKQRLTSLITLKEKSTDMVVGAYYQINATVKNDDADVKTLTYKSNNTKVATVNKNTGEVYAVGEGTTEIIISTIDGGASDVKFTVTVKANSESSLSPTIVGTFSVTDDLSMMYLGTLIIDSNGIASLKIQDTDTEEIVEQYTFKLSKTDDRNYYFSCNEIENLEMKVLDYKVKSKINVSFVDTSDDSVYMFCEYNCAFGLMADGTLDFDREA